MSATTTETIFNNVQKAYDSGFIVGAESRQAEIDDVKSCNAVLGDHIEYLKEKNTELRKALEELKAKNKKLREGINKAMDYRTPMGLSMTDWFNTIVNILCEALKNGG